MTILVLAEQHSGAITPATRATVTAGVQLGGGVHILVIGNDISGVAATAKLNGVEKILTLDGAPYEHGLSENIAPAVAGIAKNYSHVIAAATTFGKDVLPRIAALLDVAQVSDVIRIVSPDTFVHPVYAGNVLETVQAKDAIKVLTIRPTSFDKAADGGSAVVEAVSAGSDSGLSSFVSLEESKSARPELTSARVVISGGRGLGSAENFKLLEKIADKLNAAIGASRAAVDAGYVPNDYQVGQTGKVVAPELYIAIGISGAIQHLAGMKDSKIIVAINKDENAPIFEIADYGLVGDLFEILPKLEQTI
ncbi:MAG: FAD-binding protein [Rickettsiales bacterium]